MNQASIDYLSYSSETEASEVDKDKHERTTTTIK